MRSSALAGISYEMSISLDASSPVYSGSGTISFVAASTSAPAALTLDFEGGEIDSLVVNGSEVVKPDYNGLFVSLPSALLKSGANAVALRWRHPYSVTGEGLYRFQDPEDSRVYVYSDFEPFNANKLFPCFDQPDLKASFTLNVEAPAGWLVVSAARETSISDAPGARKRWTFTPTPKLSPYVFSLHAGEYATWASTAGAVPLRLFARRSLARYVDAEEWFATTRAGLDFYDRYFGIAYPFGKYDQLIVPDYNGGAMENAGAVTFSERYVRRGRRMRAERERLAGTILHEMAHMWFGNLVTPAWWDGLWLNESFAEYMATLAASKAAGFPESWRSFFIESKQAAYEEDQQPTSHPVEGTVKDTAAAFANFDDITYGKGASALKQLAYALGEEGFRDGVRLYLSRRAYGSARQNDFFAALEEASKTDLSAWRKQWLETTGVDGLSAEWSCGEDGLLKSLALTSEAAARPHHTQVGLYRSVGGVLERASAFRAVYSGARTPVAIPSREACPSLVFPNDEDFDYAKVALDERSLEEATRRLSGARDPLLRAMLWQTLWQMVRDARWPAGSYARLALSQLGAETDVKTAGAVLETLYGRQATSASVLRYLPRPDAAAFETLFLRQLDASAADSDLQKLWLDAAVEVATTPRALRMLEGWLSAPPEGLDLDQDRRWTIIERLGAMGAEQAAALIEAETRRDGSDKGLKAAISARAAAPDAAVKRLWFNRLADPLSKDTLGEQRAAMKALFAREQDALRMSFSRDFFAALESLAARKDDEFLAAFTESLAPNVCSQESLESFDAFLAKNPSLPPAVLKGLRVARHEDSLCLAARAKR